MRMLAYDAPGLLPVPRSASCQQFSAPGPPIALHRPHEEGRVAAAVRASKLYRQRCRHGAVGFGTAVPALCRFADIGVVARVCSKGVLTKDPISIWLKKWRSGFYEYCENRKYRLKLGLNFDF
jgi:hypothetical protein